MAEKNYNSGSKENIELKPRYEFMIHIYDQMFRTFDSTRKNIWNLIYIVGGGLAVLKMYSIENLSVFDIGFFGYLLGLIWILFRLIDAIYWNNRNLFIISNIEEKILEDVDINNIFKDFRGGKIEDCNKTHTYLKYEKFFVYLYIFLSCFAFLYIRKDVLYTFYIFVFLMVVLFSSCYFSSKRARDFSKKAGRECENCSIKCIKCPIVKFLSELF